MHSLVNARRSIWPLVILLLCVGALVTAPLSGLSTAVALNLLGIPDPGPLTTIGLPVVRTSAEILCACAVGLAMFASFFTAQLSPKSLDVDGFRAQRMSSLANFGFAAAAFFLVPLTLSDASGMPLSSAIGIDQWFTAVDKLDVASSWRWTGLIAFVAAIGQRISVSWRLSVIWFALSALAILPVALTGHSASGGAHDMATNALILHIYAAIFWLGGLVAVLAHALRGGTQIAVALRRLSVVATIALATVAITGVINTVLRIPLNEIVGSSYGSLLLIKAAAVIALGFIGWAVRRRVISKLPADDSDAPASWRTFVRIAVPETLIIAATIAVAVSLGRTPPPAPAYIPGIQETLLGFQLPGDPTAWTLLTHWRFDLILGTAAIAALVLYLAGLRRLAKRGDKWPIGRTIAWVSGCITLLISTSSGLGMYAMAQFSIHMTVHMMLSMLVPVLLALGGPMTLALRALRPAGRHKPPGPREWLVEFINNPLSRFITHPVVASVQFVVGFYALYLTGLYAPLVENHAGHVFMNIHFLISGYIFYWVIIGVDAAPRQFSPITKLLTLLSSLPFHAFFGIALINWKVVLAEDWYRGLNMWWVPDLLYEQQVGGGVAWAAGEIPLFVVVVALSMQWRNDDERDARRYDRKADRDHDADLDAYNAMLKEMAASDTRH